MATPTHVRLRFISIPPTSPARSMWMAGFYRYENLQLRRTDSFCHAEKGIAFDMNQRKTLLD